MVRVIGFEPIRDRSREILSLLRLPISPYSHIYAQIFSCYAMQRLSLLRLPVSPYRRVFVGFSSRRLRRFARSLAAPSPIFLRAVVDLLSVRRRPFFRAAAFCRRSRLGWRCAPCEAPSPRLFRGGRGRKRPPLHAKRRPIFWRRHPDLNRGVRALQALALPLGYSAKNKVRNRLERETRFELATFTLAR